MTVANVNVTKVLFKRGNTAQNNNYTGVNGEISIDTQAKTLRIHDGITPGGNVVTGGGTAGSYSDSNVASYLSSFDGNILPAANVTYSLGDADHQWKDLWVSNNTIYIGNTPVRVDGDTLLINNSPVTGGITANLVNGSYTVELDSTGNVTLLYGAVLGDTYGEEAIMLQSPMNTYSGINSYNRQQWITTDDDIVAIGTGYSTGTPKDWYFDKHGNITLPSGGDIIRNGVSALGTDNTLRANVGAYQIYSNANAATQTISIDSINSNITAANSAIQSLSANVGTLIVGAPGVLDTLLELGNALGNSASFSSTVINWLGNITSNVTEVNNSIDTVNANIGEFQTYANLHFLDSAYGDSNVTTLLSDLTNHGIGNVGTISFNGDGTQYIYMNTSTPGAKLGMYYNEAHGFTIGEDGIDLYTYTGTASDYNHWYLNTDGNLALPGGSTIGENGSSLVLTPSGATSEQKLKIYPTMGGGEGDHIHLTSGDLSTTSIFLGSDTQYVRTRADGAVVIGTNDTYPDGPLYSGKRWQFDPAGNITIPGDIHIKNNLTIQVSGIPTSITAITGSSGSWESNPQSNLATTGGTGTGLTVDVIESGGYANTISIHTPGSGYSNGDEIFVTSGSSSAAFTISVSVSPWTFGTDGVLTAPDIVIAGNTNLFGSYTALIQPTDNLPIATISSGTAGGITSVWIEDLGDVGNSNIAAIYTPLPGTGTVRVVAGSNATSVNLWDFNPDGNLTLPAAGYLQVGSGIVAGFASSPAPRISGFSTISAENFTFLANGVNILSAVSGGDGGTYSNINVAAYLSTITTSNVGAGNLTVINNFSSNVISANSFTYANGVNILSTISAGSTYSNVNVEAYIGGNIGAYQTFANANAATQATSINTVNANIGSFQTYANATFSTSTYSNTTANALLSSNTVSTINTTGNIVTIANVIATTFRFANGVNILSSVTAVANLSNLTGNISWTAVGATPPTFTTASNGTKIVLWPSISSTMVDYAIGIEAGNTWFSIPQATNNFGYKWYAGNTTIATLSGNGTLTTGNITTTGSVSATNFVGNGVGLTNVTVSAAGNIVGTSSNVTLVAGNYSYTFDNTGNVTLPANVFVGVTNTFLPNTVASFSSNVNYYSQVTLQNKSSGNDATADYIVTANNGSDTVNFLDLGIINSGYDNTTPSNSLGNIVYAADSYIYAQGNTSNANQSGGNLAIGTATAGKTIKFFAGGTTSSAIAMTVASTGVTVGGNLAVTGTLSGSGSGLTGVALKTTGSWTVTTGTGTYSFTVPASGTYQLWVDCNIPNGILVWNATATITNSNVPVVGAQYAWVYNAGGSPIDFTSIPNQFTGTGNTIVRSGTSPSATTNRFDFGFNNTSGGSVTVRYGWVAIS